MPFREAAQTWLETRKPYLSTQTVHDYTHHIKTLTSFFRELRLPEIGSEEIRSYQRMRMARAGASLINHEVCVLQQILKRVGRWAEVAQDYQPLPLPRESPHRALSADEEERLSRIGISNPKWEVAYCAYVIMINTAVRPGELRHTKLGDLDCEQRVLYVRGTKTKAAARPVPLNQTAWNAVQYLIDRAKKLGATEQTHYLLPYMVSKGQYDAERPCKGWRAAHKQMTRAAGIYVAPYTFRHHPLTKMLENPGHLRRDD